MVSFNLYKTALLSSSIALLCWPSQILAKTVDVCNAAPVKISAALAYHQEELKLVSRGWYDLSPSECTTLENVKGGHVFYAARSETQLAKWLTQKPAMILGGSTQLCVGDQPSFILDNEKTCTNEIGYRAYKLYGPRPKVVLFDNAHLGVRVNDAKSLAYELAGVMSFENSLKKASGRETPFHIGAEFEDTAQGVAITKILPGLPAEYEGLRVGDVITRLDLTSINQQSDITHFFDTLPFDRIDPLQIEIDREGQNIVGRIMPIWFAFNHPLYEQTSPGDVFWWDFADGMALDFGNELACGIGSMVKESSVSIKKDRSPEMGRVMAGTSYCAAQKNRRQKLVRLFHHDAAMAGSWASIVGFGGAFKLGRTAKLTRYKSPRRLTRTISSRKYRSFK